MSRDVAIVLGCLARTESHVAENGGVALLPNMVLESQLDWKVYIIIYTLEWI